MNTPPSGKVGTVLAVGASGRFAGLVVPELAQCVARVWGLVRKSSEGGRVLEMGASEIAIGDLTNDASMDAALQGVASVFYIAPAFILNKADVGKAIVAAAKRDSGAVMIINRRNAIQKVIVPGLLVATKNAWSRNLSNEDLQEQNTISKETTMPENTLPLPADNLNRHLTIAQIDKDQTLPHIGLVGDTYTITVTGEDTAGRFCVIDMHIPPGGGPAPHRHDFEEAFILLDGEIEATFRGKKSTVRAGDSINIPANAPHQFHNASSKPARLICICSPSGQEKFFMEVGTPVATRTTPPPKLDEKQQADFIQKAKALAPQYRTELLPHA